MAETLELEDIQGIVARGYGALPAAAFLLLGLPEASRSKAWLAAVLPGVTPASQRPGEQAMQVAFTPAGLRALGLPVDAMPGFSHEFRDGMTSAHRRRVLGDTGSDAPESWQWGGPGGPAVDAVLLLYAANEGALASLAAAQEALATRHGLSITKRLGTSTVLDREPFGFRDGISQPLITGLGKTGAPENTVHAGEFVLGYENEYGLQTDRPIVAADSDVSNALPQATEGPSHRDFGKNSSYLVFRQLEQDVPGFWRHLHERARKADGAADPALRDWLAAKMVGRWPNGAPLVESPDHDDPSLSDFNDFGYHHADADGLRCPVGAHVRRANPRDSLDPNPGTADSYALNKRHRLLRRGRPYGSTLTAEQAISTGADGDGEERGLQFICITGSIARQFEFVQQTWIGNPKFAGLFESVDPVMGPRGPEGATFPIPAYPVRKRLTGLPSFVTVRGGAYFFLPGLRALRYLASLQ